MSSTYQMILFRSLFLGNFPRKLTIPEIYIKIILFQVYGEYKYEEGY